MPQPKLRIFAGPNGSGKSTLFEAIKNVYFSIQIFVNADILENQFKEQNFIDLKQFNIFLRKHRILQILFKPWSLQKSKFQF